MFLSRNWLARFVLLLSDSDSAAQLKKFRYYVVFVVCYEILTMGVFSFSF